jgi:hypothetical protein
MTTTAEKEFERMQETPPRSNGDNGPVTALTVDARVNDMGLVFNKLNGKFNKMQGTIDALSAVVSGLIANDENEMTTVIQQMDELARAMKSAPEVKRLCVEELEEMRVEISSAADELSDVEANLYLNITSELNDDDKPAYTNEAQRKNALVLAKRHNKEYQEAKAWPDKLNLDEAKLKAQLNEICESDKANRLLYRGLIARMENITARMRF